MYDTKREEIKATILKRIEDSETFTEAELFSMVGKSYYKLVESVLNSLHKKKEIDYYVSARQYVWYKVKG